MLIAEDEIAEIEQTSNPELTQSSIRVISNAAVDFYSEWCRLFDHSPQANPYQHPDYVQAELSGLKPKSKSLLTLVRSGTNNEADGFGILLPKSVQTSKVGGIGPGWTMHGFRLAGGAFIGQDDSLPFQSAMLSAAVRHCSATGAAFLLIEDLDEQSTLFQAVASQPAGAFKVFAARETQPRWRIEFPSNEEDYWKQFSGRTRRAFRTRLKKFGKTELKRIATEDQIPAFLTAAHEISKLSWQSRQFGLRIRNDDTERHCLTALARRGFLRSYLWKADGQPVAFAICTQHAGSFHYEEIAYCSQFSSLSPGETMLQQIVEDLYRHDSPNRFDFGGGDAEYKRRFGNRESRSQTVWLVPPTWRANSTLAYLNGCRGLRSRARSVVNACGLATKARQWLRYGGRAAHAKIDATKSPDVANADSPEVTGQ